MEQKEFVENIAERMIASQSDIDTPCARRAIIDFKITFLKMLCLRTWNPLGSTANTI